MDAWIDIRRKARQCHTEALRKANGDRRASALVAAALVNDDLHLRPFDKGTRYDDGVYGVLERENRIVNILSKQEQPDEAVVIAHEIGHFKLHRDLTSEVTTRTGGLGGDVIDAGAGKVEGYWKNSYARVPHRTSSTKGLQAGRLSCTHLFKQGR